MADVLRFARPVTPGVHVEDLLDAVNVYYRDVRHARTQVEIDAATEAFQKFFTDHRLPVSFAERDYTLSQET